MKRKKESLTLFLLLVVAVVFNGAVVGALASELNVNFVYTETGLRDPFAPSDYEQEEPNPADSNDFLSQKSLKLEGIMWDPVDPYIIINDEILRVGDELEGITIIKIEKESVTFGYKDKTIVIPLIGKGE